jgi:hypothetical protein
MSSLNDLGWGYEENLPRIPAKCEQVLVKLHPGASQAFCFLTIRIYKREIQDGRLLPDAKLMVVDMRVRLKLLKKIWKNQDQQRRKTLKQQGGSRSNDKQEWRGLVGEN